MPVNPACRLTPHRQTQAARVCAAVHGRLLLPPGLGTAPEGCVAASAQRRHTRRARPVAPRWAHPRHAAVPPAAQSACRGPQHTVRSAPAASSAHSHGEGGLQRGKLFWPWTHVSCNQLATAVNHQLHWLLVASQDPSLSSGPVYLEAAAAAECSPRSTHPHPRLCAPVSHLLHFPTPSTGSCYSQH